MDDSTVKIMYDFDKVKNAIVNEYKDQFIFSHCIFQSLDLLPELNSVILEMTFDDMFTQLWLNRQDEKLFIFLQVMAIQAYDQFKLGILIEDLKERELFIHIMGYIKNLAASMIDTSIICDKDTIAFSALKQLFETNEVKEIYNQIDHKIKVDVGAFDTVVECITIKYIGMDLKILYQMISDMFKTDKKYK